MNIRFRRMKKDDVPQIVHLEKTIFKDAWTENHFLAEIENKNISYPCIMQEGEKIIGYAVVWHFSGELHISNFAIVAEQRRKGYGQLLLDHILKKFSAYQEAFLEVRISNKPAIALYKKNGFEALYVRSAYYEDGEDALVMVNKIRKNI